MDWDKAERTMEFLLEQSAKRDAQLAELIRVTNIDAENIKRLANAAQALVTTAKAHERRLRRIEEQSGLE